MLVTQTMFRSLTPQAKAPASRFGAYTEHKLEITDPHTKDEAILAQLAGKPDTTVVDLYYGQAQRVAQRLADQGKLVATAGTPKTVSHIFIGADAIANAGTQFGKPLPVYAKSWETYVI